MVEMRDVIEQKKESGTHSDTRGYALPGACISILLVFSILMLSSCGNLQNRTDLAERMAAEEGRADDDARIIELKAQIRSVDTEVEKTIEAVRNKADYWRLLGLKYMDYRMWGEAMNAFGEAIAITPDRAILHYNRGLCSAQLSLSALEDEVRDQLLGQAEASYRRALAIDDRNTRSMYGLSILLVFELSRPGEAVPLLEDYLSIERSDMQARFVLARAYMETGRTNDALDMYEEISRKSENPSDVSKADDLHAAVLGGDYGS